MPGLTATINWKRLKLIAKYNTRGTKRLTATINWKRLKQKSKQGSISNVKFDSYDKLETIKTNYIFPLNTQSCLTATINWKRLKLSSVIASFKYSCLTGTINWKRLKRL